MRNFLNRASTKKSGVTFIELILYVGISAIILMVSAVFLSLLLRARIKNQVMAEVAQQGTQIMQIITQTIRDADGVNVPTTGGAGTQLSLSIPGDASPTIIEFVGSDVQIQENGGAATSLTSSRVLISNGFFQNLSRGGTPGIVRIGFDVSHVNNTGANEYFFSRNFMTSTSIRHP